MKATTKLVRPLRNGQITIPAEFRAQLAIDESTLLEVRLVSGELRLKPVRVTESADGSAWARELYDLFAPVRRETARHTGKQVNDSIDKAVSAVRRKRAPRRP